MNLLGLLFLLITQFITGRGVIELCKVKMRPLLAFCFSFIAGVAVFSFLPFILELFHITINMSSVSVTIGVTTLLFMVPLLGQIKNFKLPSGKDFKLPNLYEVPFLVVIILLVLLSLWRAWFYPPNARDMLSGPEVMADLALKEGHIINSLFTIDLQSTNNYLKPPFITSLQIIYKLYVQPFGQTWLSILFVNFIVVMYTLLKEKIHPVILGFAMLYFFGMPEVFGYTYLMLFDYSNMIFLFGGYYFLNQYFEHKDNGNFAFSVFLFTIATYIRTETLILVGMNLPIIFYYQYKDKMPMVKSAIRMAAFVIVPFVIYFLCMNVYVKHFIPIKYDVSSDINKNLGDLGPLFDRLGGMFSKLLFASETNYPYYGYFPHLFVVVILVDIVFFRKFNKEAVTLLYGIAVVYVGLAFIGYLLPLADLMHTTKRGLFKMFPLILLYYRDSPSLLKLTDIIRNWENGVITNKPQPPRPQQAPPKPAIPNQQKKK
jgi:hypothetical protein